MVLECIRWEGGCTQRLEVEGRQFSPGTGGDWDVLCCVEDYFVVREELVSGWRRQGTIPPLDVYTVAYLLMRSA
jgi:hypothetical protein